MLRRLLIFVFIVMTTSTFAQTPTIDTGVSQTLAKWRAANYSDVRYKLNLTLEKMSPTLKGAIEVSVNLKTASDIVLDWRKIKGKEEFYKIATVGLNGAKVEAKEINEHLVINGGKPGANTIKLDFESPIATSGAAITRYVDKEDGAEYVYSLFVPSDASTAFPVFDQPDLKARFTLSVDKPSGWRVVSNGLPNMYKTGKFDEFFETERISPYVFAFAAGDFKVFTENFSDKGLGNVSGTSTDARKISEESRKLTGNYIYVRKSQAEKFKAYEKEVFRLNREGVKFLESWFDYKFPFPKYDLVLIPEFPFGGMEHAGATFLRESSIIFPQEPTKNDFVSRANLIFHEAAHQWFGDTVTMKWFDDLWLKEGFAEFMAYKTLEKVLPEYNAWKIFYERNKQLAYLTDSTKGTTPIYQEIPNLSAAKSAYGNIVYRKAPSFLRQAEFYLGADKFQTAVRAFLKKHEFANAEWTDLVKEFGEVQVAELKTRDYYQKIFSAEEKNKAELSTKKETNDWANIWVKTIGVFKCSLKREPFGKAEINSENFSTGDFTLIPNYKTDFSENSNVILLTKFKTLIIYKDGTRSVETFETVPDKTPNPDALITKDSVAIIPNYQDYGYGIFLLDERSRAYVLRNIQNEKDDFLRTMMWGSLWDSVREAELNPKEYVELVVKNIEVESDESTIQTLLNRVSTAMNYYLSDTQSKELAAQLEALLIQKMQNAPTLGQRITFYRAFLNVASTDIARATLKDVLSGKLQIKDLKLKAKDKFDIVTRLLILSDKDAPNLLAELEKSETSDEAKRYAYAAKAGIATAENKQKFFSDFVGNKEISESYIESAFVPFNSVRHADLTLPYLEKALAELPNLKRSRKIFFVNGWLSAFIGGQKSENALQIVNKFLADNPNLDKDLRLKVLEVADGLERAVKIRAKY